MVGAWVSLEKGTPGAVPLPAPPGSCHAAEEWRTTYRSVIPLLHRWVFCPRRLFARFSSPRLPPTRWFLPRSPYRKEGRLGRVVPAVSGGNGRGGGHARCPGRLLHEFTTAGSHCLRDWPVSLPSTPLPWLSLSCPSVALAIPASPLPPFCRGRRCPTLRPVGCGRRPSSPLLPVCRGRCPAPPLPCPLALQNNTWWWQVLSRLAIPSLWCPGGMHCT